MQTYAKTYACASEDRPLSIRLGHPHKVADCLLPRRYEAKIIEASVNCAPSSSGFCLADLADNPGYRRCRFKIGAALADIAEITPSPVKKL
ncbi:hypothetical protein BVI1335_2510002 [Burkholderia vietnamiensis]|nr:hypothetical protein BVI1335_2510002 [Burkholderia vietnamiensis]